MNKKLNIWKILFLLFLMIASALIIRNNYEEEQNKKDSNIEIQVVKVSEGYTKAQGKVFGTTCTIIYHSDTDYSEEIENALLQVDLSLSPFNNNSVITAINENTSTMTDNMFVDVFNLAQEVSEKTDGAFDITVAPLVNAWGFGFKQGTPVDSATVDSLRDIVGYRKVKTENGKIMKEDARIMLDCSAIAKGYGCDMVADMLTGKGIKDFMVEIGGEIAVKGMNLKGEPWNIGINKPIDDRSGENTELAGVVKLNNKCMATSGNYRNYRMVDGKKYAHTIDPRTGYPVEHSLLSATVIADDCATADAYATAFMVMGLEKALEICSKEKGIEAYFIYTDEDGLFKTAETEGMKRFY